MKIVLHIGVHKTGSTAIQRFFWYNRQTFHARGILYPSAFVTLNAHHQLAWSLSGQNHRLRHHHIHAEDIVRKIQQEANLSGPNLVLISSEEFDSIYDQFALVKLKELFAPIPIQVIIYLRQQDEVLLSAYNQRLKMYESKFHGTIEELSRDRRLLRRLNYWSLTERWSRVFGDEALNVRRYIRKQFPSGNIISDFLTAINTPVQGLDIDKWRNTNQSIHPLTLEVLKRLKKKNVSRRLFNIMRSKLDTQAKVYPVSTARLPGGFRQHFLEQFQQSNERVARKYFPNANGVLFPDEPQTGESWHDVEMTAWNNELLIDMLLDNLIAAVEKLPELAIIPADMSTSRGKITS